MSATASDPAIAWYVPNVIGYARAIFTVWSLYVAPSQPVTCLVLYVLSFVLDAADGHAARMLNQCSKFGAVLDMVIDRASTSGFLVILASLLGSEVWSFPAAMLIMLDLVSHYVRMYSSLTIGESSHKNTDKIRFRFLRHYYGNKPFMCFLCVGQEAMYLCLYAQHFFPLAFGSNPAVWQGILVALFLPFAGKQWANVLQLVDGMMALADTDVADFHRQRGARRS